MGLLQKACETYDCHARYAGLAREGHETLAPVGHTLTSAQIEITLDGDGGFCSARAVDKSEPKIIIPVTMESASRSSTSAKCFPHPLCDKLSYLIAEENYFIPQLEQWADSEHSHPKLKPILSYLKRKTMVDDLLRADVIKVNERGYPMKDDAVICWNVIGIGEKSGPCWTDQSLIQAFSDYYFAQQKEYERSLCMVSGEWAVLTKKHTGAISTYGNAKLISANDDSGFTYRGRFTDEQQAETVSYLASQKAHNALRWLAAEQGRRAVAGGRTFLCWNPQGNPVPGVVGPFHIQAEQEIEPSDYRAALRRTLDGYRSELPEETAGVVIAAFDAATPGRLSVTYYNELQASDFLQRLHDWDAHCCWWNGKFGIQSPPLWQIASCAFGTQRGETRMECDDRVMRQQMQRLIACRVDGARIPTDIKRALVQRASTPQCYDRGVWKRILFTACAVMNQYEYQTRGEACMAWELDKRDRSFQYGRLLAAMERAEADFINAANEDRQTNAIKLMSVFRQRPWTVYEQVNRQLNLAYLPRILPWQRRRYEQTVAEIMELLRTFPEEALNRPLDDSYLMGYHCQSNDFFKPKKEKTAEENEHEHTGK